MATFQPDLRRTFPKPPPIATGPGGVPVGSPTVPEAAGLGNFIPTLGPHIVPGSAAAPTQGGVPDMTLDALMARQKELASQQSEMPTMMAPTQGLAYALQQGMQGFQRGRTDRDTTRSRDELAQIMSEVDPATGPNQEQMGRLMQISPDSASSSTSRAPARPRRSSGRRSRRRRARTASGSATRTATPRRSVAATPARAAGSRPISAVCATTTPRRRPPTRVPRRAGIR